MRKYIIALFILCLVSYSYGQEKPVTGKFKPGDAVVHVLKVNFNGVPAYFKPDAYVAGVIKNIDENGLITVYWENGKTTTVQADTLAKLIERENGKELDTETN
jgi:hypothetical protein